MLLRLVNSGSRSKGSRVVNMSTQQYLPQLRVHKLISGARSAHTRSLTDKQHQAVQFLDDRVETTENYSGKCRTYVALLTTVLAEKDSWMFDLMLD